MQESGRKTLLCPDALFYHDFTQRTENPPWRQLQFLLGMRYLAYKWSCPEFAHKIELLLFKRGLILKGSELPPTPRSACSYGKRKMNFDFATLRW